MKTAIVTCTLIALLVAGCVSPPGTSKPGDEVASHRQAVVLGEKGSNGTTSFAFGSPVRILAGCQLSCYEPSAAVDKDGRVFVTSMDGRLARSLDAGASFELLNGPPPPAGAPPGALVLDQLVQAIPDDRLCYSALFQLGEFVSEPPHPLTITHLGFQVACSKDAGNSWISNAYVSPLSDLPASYAAKGDRQWLSFGPKGEIYLQWVAYPITPFSDDGIWVARSKDGGKSFAGFSPVTNPAVWGNFPSQGAAMVDPGGRIVLPFFPHPGAVPTGRSLGLTVALSDDEGATFKFATIWAPSSSRPGGGAPSMALDQVGNPHSVWFDGTGGILTSSSDDHGATWSTPVRWNPPNNKAINDTPWPWAASPTAGQLAAAWFSPTSGGKVSLMFAEGNASEPATRVFTLATLDAPSTDFAHFALLPGGGVAIPWTDGKNLWIAIGR